MFDTMTMTKVIGALCGSLLIFLLGGWAAEIIYHGGGGHDDRQAYIIEVETDEVVEDVVEEIDFAIVMASASAADGEALWRNCRSCHALEAGVNGVGPYLHGVVGRDVGAASGYNSYSGALTQVADVWTPENLNGFLENPSAYAPGTSMGYRGMRSVEDRANLIAYLDSIDN
ncbi:c-type cytochrome [Yoonia sp.]|uniref:c-type cytochrome n=1 Tax=Yoonia sp. TaxID=2212373 RepID=UPI001A0278C6|nr:c-type cytochrome [Yoonia sp.]MBE0412195.1 c-type cytochrome [Yoonia sp.]